MKSKYSFLLVLLLIGVIFISGCVSQETSTDLPNSSTQKTQQPPSSQVIAEKVTQSIQYKDSLNFLLDLNDFPQNENWTLDGRGERSVNDVLPIALEHNWSGGYDISFSSSEKDKTMFIIQALSIYPDDDILDILDISEEVGSPLSNPFIGEHSKAAKFGSVGLPGYKITFVKNNLFVTIATMGDVVDYPKLKELAQKAYDKIDGYGKPFVFNAKKSRPIVSQPKTISLSAIINSASDKGSLISDPILTLTNLGNSTVSVSDIVIDIELYRGEKLITSETDVSYMSGSNSIEIIPVGESTKGSLRLWIYSGNTNDFVSGTYLLKVIIRNGANPKPIATAEKAVEITAT